MSKRLELLFKNEEGRSVTLSVDDPIEPLDQVLITNSMNEIITGGTIVTSGGNLTAIIGARVVERNVTPVEL